MLKKLLVLIACLAALSPTLSFGFDCNKPNFGATIQELNKDGEFVKYLEKGGVSYYNYTGPCKMEMHSLFNPSISYAFVNDQLYARIVHITCESCDMKKVDATLMGRISKQIGVSEMKKKRVGNWTIHEWTNESEKTKFKLKIHKSGKDRIGAFYYEPLRAKLKGIKGAKDPVDKP